MWTWPTVSVCACTCDAFVHWERSNENWVRNFASGLQPVFLLTVLSWSEYSPLKKQRWKIVGFNLSFMISLQLYRLIVAWCAADSFCEKKIFIKNTSNLGSTNFTVRLCSVVLLSPFLSWLQQIHSHIIRIIIIATKCLIWCGIFNMQGSLQSLSQQVHFQKMRQRIEFQAYKRLFRQNAS